MSAVWLYGLLRCPDLAARLAADPIEGLSNHGFGPVEAMNTDGLMLAFSSCDGGPVPQRRRYLKGHAQVLESLMEHGPLLPFRFGHVVRDPGRMAGLVAQTRPDIDAKFAQIDGHAEVGLRISFDREAALATTLAEDRDLSRERDALIARRGGTRMQQIDLGRHVAEALDTRRTACQRALLRTLTPLCRDHVLQSPEEDCQVLRAAFLVPEQAMADFTQAVEEAAATCGFTDTAPRIRIVHPTPPFNFVRLSLGADPDSEVA